ncbi:MAG: hypothetical protein NC191_00025 [Muribaculaceae bacterium]|nr:hypothetical protein [Muribaculaceae bacterium]
MEIRNNYAAYTYKPAFGAFIKPKAEDMAAFRSFITSEGKVPFEIAKKGLARVVARHADDKHFNLRFVAPDNVTAEVISDAAKDMRDGGKLLKSAAEETPIQKLRSRYTKKKLDEADNLSILGKIAFVLKAHAALLRAKAQVMLHPESRLPKILRAASENVSRWETEVESAVEAERAAEIARVKKMAQDGKQLKKLDSIFGNQSDGVKDIEK